MIDLLDKKYVAVHWSGDPEQDKAFSVFHEMGMLSDSDIALLDKNYDYSLHTYDQWRELAYNCLERGQSLDVDQKRYRRRLKEKIESSVKSFNCGDSYATVVDKIIEFGNGLITTSMYRKRRYPHIFGTKMEITNPRNGWFALCDYCNLADAWHEHGYKRVNHSCWQVYDKDGKMRLSWGEGFNDALAELVRC
tara:strand:+ start:1645 stop:2223 length:579 start_codon:yes stop_codon:yes gene_type:complete